MHKGPAMKRSIGSLLLAAMIATSSAALAQPTPGSLWLNPRGTVAVQTGACNGKLCGWIVWANPTAIADARESGVDRLIGTELLEDYEADGPGMWSGEVYVPDMGRHFSSTITQLNPSSLRIKGCLIGGFLCKSQDWQRIETLPHG